jgi:integrase/recombinase XerD
MKRDRNGTSRILSQEEYQELLQVLKPKFRTLLKLCLLSGFRISEALSIRKTDLVEDTIILRKNNTKGRLETREIPIPPSLVAELHSIKTEGNYFFSAANPDRPMTRQNADFALRYACQQLGIEGTSWHYTRRRFITELHHSQVPMKVIQKAVGHKSLTSTSKYIEVSDSQVNHAVSLLWQAI